MATVEVATPEPSKDVYDSGNDKLDIKRRRRSITDQTSVTEGDVTQTVDDHDDIDDSEAEFEKEEQNAKKEEMLQEVMTDHLDIMLAIIMKIRENEDFAVSIYANCPRLQHLLNQHPDLRPVFEDPNLIRINFEEVYRKAGGVLPEDKPDRFKLLLKYIVNHPLFRIFRFLLLIKKLYTFVMGSGIAVFKGLYSVCFPDPATIAELEDGDVPLEEDAANLANRDALNQAADYMETLEVQTKMHEVLESNPDNLQDVVEQDPELKALRDANPLCAELMNDPETMRILVDPDNLRALAECPDLIAADFASPDWAPPDIESVTFDDSTAVPIPMEPLEATSGEEVLVEVAVLEDPDAADVAADAAEEGEAEGEEEQGEEEEEEEEEFMEGFERGEESDTKGAGKLSSSSTASKNRQSSTKERVRAYVTSLGTGLVDYVAGETVGITMSEAGLTGGEENDALEVPDGEGEPIEEEEPEVGEEAEPAESSAADNFAENIEGNMDTIQDAHDSNTDGATTAAVGGTAAAGGVAVAFGQHRQVGDRCSSDDLDEDEMDDNYDGYASPQKGGVMSMAGSFARTSMAALGSATSAQIATSLLGDELGANFIEKLGSKGENTEDEPDQPVKGSMVGRAGRAIRGSVVAMGEAATTTFVGVDISEGLVGRLDGETRGKNDNDGVQKDTQKDK